jgi:hypothetical protein
MVGSSYAFAGQGEDRQGILQIAGVVTLNTGGGATGTLSWDDLSGSSSTTPEPFTGSYTVDPTGRVTLTNLTNGSGFSYSLHFYLNGSGGGLVLSNDSDDVFAGAAFQQQAGTFSESSFSGNYGLNASVYNVVSGAGFSSAVGPITATPGSDDDAVTGFADLGAGLPDFAISGSFTPATNGVFTGTLSGLGAAAASSSNPFVLYLIDDTQGAVMELGNSELTLGRYSNKQ